LPNPETGHLEPDFSMWQLLDFGALMGEIMATYGHIWPPSPQKVVSHAMNDIIEAISFWLVVYLPL